MKITQTPETKPHASTGFRSRGQNPFAPKEAQESPGSAQVPEKAGSKPFQKPISNLFQNVPEQYREAAGKAAKKDGVKLKPLRPPANEVPVKAVPEPEKTALPETLHETERLADQGIIAVPESQPVAASHLDTELTPEILENAVVPQKPAFDEALSSREEDLPETTRAEAPEKSPENTVTSEAPASQLANLEEERIPETAQAESPEKMSENPAVPEVSTSTSESPEMPVTGEPETKKEPVPKAAKPGDEKSAKKESQQKKEEGIPEDREEEQKEEKDAGPAPVEVNFENPAPVQEIRMDPATDKAGQPIMPDEAANNNVLGLAIVAQQFRDQGKEARDRAVEQTALRVRIEGQLKQVEREVGKSDKGLQKAQKNTEFRAKKLKQVDKPLATSVKRQQKTASGVGAYISKYNENKGTAKDLNKDSAGLLGGSKKNQDPEDSDSGALTGNFEEMSSGTDTMAQGMAGAGSKAKQLATDAKIAGAKNTRSDKNLSDSKAMVKKSETKIKSEQGRNKTAHGELKRVKPGLAESKRTEEKLKTEGESLMTTSFEIENETQRAQYFYYKDMAQVEGEEELYLEEERTFEKKLGQRRDGEALVFKYAMLRSEAEQTEFVEKLDEKQRLQLGQELEKFTANYDSWVEEKQTFFLSNVQKKRGDKIDANNNKRNLALQSPLDRVTANLDKVSKTGLFWSSLTKSLGDMWNSLTSITWADIGGLGLAMINPLETYKTISQNIVGIWNDLSDWGGFSEDPVGMILQKGSSVAVKLATISGVITGLLFVLTIAAGIGTFFTGGALLGLTIWLADATAMMGTITFWIGLVAAALSFLSGMKNIYDMHSAKTADVLFQETAALKKDTGNTGAGILAMIGGKASAKGARQFKTAFMRSPKAFLKQKFLTLPLTLVRGVVKAPRKIGSLFRKDTWRNLLADFKKYLSKKTNKLFDPKKSKFSEADDNFSKYGKYEDKIDGSTKERMYDKAKREVGDGPHSGGKARALVLARIIAEANDRIDTPVPVLLAELAPLKAIKGVTGFGSEEKIPGSGNFKIYMFGSKFDVDKNYTTGDSENKGDSFTDYNSARNAALEWLSERDFRAEKTVLGKFGTSKGRPIGKSTLDGKKGFRVEYDDRSGAHINVWNNKEKGPHFKFQSSEKTVNQIIKRFL